MPTQLAGAAAAVCLLLPALSAAPATTRAAPDAPAVLRVEVTDLRRHKGQLIFGLFASPDGFPTDDRKAVAWQTRPADADTVVFTAEVPPGRYGASVLHDENGNARMDRNVVGIPKEGYGVTNNPKPRRRPATFEEALFTLPPAGTTMTISIQYF